MASPLFSHNQWIGVIGEAFTAAGSIRKNGEV